MCDGVVYIHAYVVYLCVGGSDINPNYKLKAIIKRLFVMVYIFIIFHQVFLPAVIKRWVSLVLKKFKNLHL